MFTSSSNEITKIVERICMRFTEDIVQFSFAGIRFMYSVSFDILCEYQPGAFDSWQRTGSKKKTLESRRRVFFTVLSLAFPIKAC